MGGSIHRYGDPSHRSGRWPVAIRSTRGCATARAGCQPTLEDLSPGLAPTRLPGVATCTAVGKTLDDVTAVTAALGKARHKGWKPLEQ